MIRPIRKKLIEVALPLEAINKASVRENYIYRGNPSAIHKWWAQRPLAAARAVIFAQMVDDPSSHPDIFRTEKAQEKERQRLFRIIEDLVQWENITNDEVLERARAEIWQSWRSACADYGDHPRAKVLFDRHKLPVFHDPFCGGGTLPLEAQRLGLESYASDLNPVAVLITKALIEISPRFADRRPVNPQVRAENSLIGKTWKGAHGLAEDLRQYGEWIRKEAASQIGHLYPKVEITAEMATERPDLRPLVGCKLTVIAWLWARTVKSPNPAFAKVDVPLASTFMISTKVGKETYVEPVVENGDYRFTVKVGTPKDAEAAKNGTKLSRGANFRCLMSGVPIAGDHIKAEGRAKGLGARMMAVVAEGERGRVYLPPIKEFETIASEAEPKWEPEGAFVEDARAFTPFLYGLTKWSDLYTRRQLVALTTFCDIVSKAHERVEHDAIEAGLANDGRALDAGGSGATAYADALAVYFAFAIDKHAIYGNSLVTWYTKEDRPSMLFSQQVLPMVWDFVELNPFADVGGCLGKSIGIVAGALDGLPSAVIPAKVAQDSATTVVTPGQVVVSTDPPYYDNVPYADLSDFFYVLLRRSLRSVFPKLFTTLASPKAEELVATPYRHGGKQQAEAFFMKGMTLVMHRLTETSHPAFPVTIYYAFKQSETKNVGTASTGWETFLDAVIQAGFAITGTWPMRTERSGRVRDTGSNALASSIILVCRPRTANAAVATRRDFLAALKAELPEALAHLQHGNIAPVDLAQAAIGPGMAVYTRYAKVLDAEGKALTVRDALSLINQTLDEALAEQEGDFDADSRWAITWFEQSGFDEGEFGVADVLARAKNTAVAGLMEAKIVASSRGKVRLLKPDELIAGWDPGTDPRLTAWEVVHQLIRALEAGGEGTTAALVAKLGAKAEISRELAYRLYTVCERKKRAAEALSYNGLVQSWPEITRLAREGGIGQPAQAQLFEQE